MIEHYKRISVRLSKKEYITLKKKAEKCCLKMDPMVRKMIMETEIKEARAPNEYVALIREINAIGNNINQIAHIANAQGRISENDIIEVKKYLSDIMQLVRGLR